MKAILLFFAAALVFPSLCAAQRISTSFGGATLTVSFAPPSGATECTYLLYTSASSSRLKGSFRKATLLGQFFGGPSTLVAQSTNVPNFMRTRRSRGKTRKLHFRAVSVCAGQVAVSNRVSLKIPRLSGQGVADDGSWFAAASAGFGVSTVELRRVFVNLSFEEPIDFQNAGDNRIFVAEKAGQIRVFLNDNITPTASTFLDIRSGVDPTGEQGLLGFAFHPQYASNGFVFVHYTSVAGATATISRFHVDPLNPNAIDPASEQVILQIPATTLSNHKGGQIAFGPDGYLYIAVGDGGGAGDPFGSGQNPNSLLGKILRIDVDQTSGGLQYAVPAGNPFIGGAGGREEIFALGMRNPFRMSFDPSTGFLWVGDVGQGAFEEINVVEAGENYGWNTMEGAHCYSPSSGCNQTGLTLPIFEYAHNGASASITGGRVYRGTRNPTLAGKYIYADFIDGRVDALDTATLQNTELFNTSLNWSSFGTDANGELFLLSYGEGKIYALTPPGGF